MLRAAGKLMLSAATIWKRGGIIVNEHTLSRSQTALHLEVLGRSFEFISISDLPSRLASPGRRPFCILTFDDGKRSNSTETAPELVRRGIPATFYITTDAATDGNPFWFDRHAAITHKLGYCPPELELSRLKQLPMMQLREAIEAACRTYGLDGSIDYGEHKPMTWDQIRDLSRKGFTIGAHGLSHAILTRETGSKALQEISLSIQRVTRETGSACTSFAFPNGNFTAELACHALRSGATTVMTTQPLWVSASSPMWQLPRIQLHPGFDASRIMMKIGLAAVSGTLPDPNGCGRNYLYQKHKPQDFIQCFGEVSKEKVRYACSGLPPK